jgi:hemoglobin/transferrin/lactoferrin receptor protein
MNKTFFYITAVCSVAFTLSSYGQKQSKQELDNDSVSVTEKTINIGEVVVSSLRMDRQVKKLPAPMIVMRAYDYQRQSALTISNVLDKEPGVAMGGDGVWATNVNIRGLSENRLVTLIDGNRVETANDLTASLSMIDINDIDRVEIIKGAQSSLYGTGAMGGIINIITKDGHFSEKPYLSGNVGSGFASVNKLFSGHVDMNTGSEKWYFRLSGTYSNADDLQTPKGEMPNSQYKSDNITAKLGIKTFNNQVFKIQFQHYKASDVGIPGGNAFPGPAEATYTGIGRNLLSASYEISDITDKLSSLKFNYFNQYIDRNVSVIPNTVTEATLANGNIQRTTPYLMIPVGKHLTNGGQIQSTWKLSDKNTLIAGVDAWSRKLTTERTKYITSEILNTKGDVIKTNSIIRGETPIPESYFSSSGLFIQDENKLLNDRLTLIIGGRLDGVWIKNDEGYDVDYTIINNVENYSPARRVTFVSGSENSVSWSANAGLLYKLFNNTDLSFNLARSFRAPSLEERFKYIDLGNYVRLGDPSLEPERGLSVDMGVRKWNQDFSFQTDVFVNYMTNMIVEVPGEFIYTSITGTVNTTDTLPAFINSNVSRALLYGIDCKFEYNFDRNFVLYGSGSFVRGKDTEANENLPLIPPMNGRLGIRYVYNKIGTAEFSVAGATKQTKIADGEKETKGYTRLDMAINSDKIKIGKTGLQLIAGIDNITNKSYTNHLSTNRGSISVEPGRNFYVRFNLSF